MSSKSSQRSPKNFTSSNNGLPSKTYLPSTNQCRAMINHNVLKQCSINSCDGTMPKKRKSRGRAKGGKGHSDYVHCSKCGSLVPRDKAKKFTSRVSLVEHSLAKELRATGTYISSPKTVKYYCVSCAVHYGLVKVRARKDRRSYR